MSNIFGGTCYGKCVVSCHGCISANIKQIQKLCHILHRTPFRLNYSCKKLHLRYDGNLHLKFFKYLESNIILLTISQSFASTVQKNCCEQTLRKVNITKIKPFSKRNYVSYCRYILKPKQNVFYFLGYSLIKVSYTFWFQD